ncbi:MAG: choice-of-anchor L domain-containing protein [Flavobacteriales bacterium]|nr:choice-of-anchor L domain-containing protein [Flavobacteriales bacterium]
MNIRSVKLNCLFLLFSIFNYTFCLAQLDVQQGFPYSAQYLVQNVLAGQGVTISNVNFQGDQWQMGYFDGSQSNIGLNEGVVLATGDAVFLEGQNNVQNASIPVLGWGGDADLTAIAGNQTFDKAVLEFDFVPQGNEILFRYVFGSEEYDEFVCSPVNDAFGFFLSGPGIVGPYNNGAQNIALIPGSNTQVSINSVNNGSVGANGTAFNCISLANSAYYVSNAGGTTTQLDGFTVVLEARSPVQCGQTYHIKMAIADAGDPNWDSGVFLEAQSLKSKEFTMGSSPSNSGAASDTIMQEGCGNNLVTVYRNGSNTEIDTMILNISGSATNGVDYTGIPDTVIFGIGIDSVQIYFDALIDNIVEGTEIINIGLTSMCGVTVDSAITLSITDPFTINETIIDDTCSQNLGSICVNTIGGVSPFTLTWSNGSSATCIQNLAHGTYDVTIIDSEGCQGQEQFSVANSSPNISAGNDATIDTCISSSSFNLFGALGGNPDAGGSWFPNTISGNGIYNPISDPAGIYTYTVAGPPGCPSVSADVTINLFNPPNAGQNAAVTLCNNSLKTSLFHELSGNPEVGGTWSPSLSSGNDSLNPAVDPAGNYTYTVLGIHGCPDSSAQVSVLINAPLNAGNDNFVDTCVNSASFSLLPYLGPGADPSGAWLPNLAGGLFDPSIDTAGVYEYVVPANGNCPGDTARVNVAFTALPNAGLDSVLSICITAPILTLANYIGGTPDPGGVWSATTNTPGQFDPSIDNPGNHSYTVTGVDGCPDAISFVTVNVNALNNPGTDHHVFLCNTDVSINLFDSLGGTPQNNGVWLNTPSSGTSMFDPSVDVSGQFIYEIAGSPGCPDTAATVTVTVDIIGDPGLDSILDLCAIDAPANLFTHLSGTPQTGGAWSPPTNGLSGIFDPAIDTSGTYSYTISGVGSCPDVSANVSVSVIQPVDAGLDNVLNLCVLEPNFSAFDSLLGSPDPFGTWSPQFNSNTNIFNPSNDLSGTYTYTVLGQSPCPDDQSQLTINLISQFDATIKTVVPMCSHEQPITILSADPGGIWNGVGIVDSLNGVFDPVIAGPGNHFITYMEDDYCGNSDTTVITVHETPTARFITDSIGQCSPVVVDFINQSTGPYNNCEWHFGNGETSYDCNPSLTFSESGSFDVVLVINSNYCEDSIRIPGLVNIPLNPVAKFEFSPENLTLDYTTVAFSNYSLNYDSLSWDFAISESINEENPIVTYPYNTDGQYEVCLEAFNVAGCVSEYCDVIEILPEFYLYVPNAFSPNGNNVNDQFGPSLFGKMPLEYTFQIFNRWGDKVFETRNTTEKWDGTFNNKLADSEVYIWKLELLNAIDQQYVTKSGHVTLIR